jgi:hypothetical protein
MGAGKSTAAYSLRTLASYNFIELGVIMGINFDIVRGEIGSADSV